MAREIAFQNGQRVLNPSARVQGNGIDIGISRAFGVELAGFVQFGKRFVVALEAHERQAKRVMKAGVARRRDDCVLQDLYTVTVAPALPIEIGKIDRRGRKLRA